MMAMMGALDGQPGTLSGQGLMPQMREEQVKSQQSKGSMKGVLGELKNLQITEQNQKKRRSKSPLGKENADSPLRMSHLQNGQTVEVYRVSTDAPDSAGMNFYPNFLRIPAERDEGVRFPHISKGQEAWGPRQGPGPGQGIPDMPLLHVDRTVPGHKFPVNQRPTSLPNQQFGPGFFQPPQGMGSAPAGPSQPLPPRDLGSPDSGIGIPLLRLQSVEERANRQPRFGELLPPNVVNEMTREKYQEQQFKERYLREYHELQVD